MASEDAIAPFVLKTYQMVNDPSSDTLIRWGETDNSFIIVDTLHFSQSLLPAFFKHNNFSSFIRQLNTYGFKKVDLDKCEFANKWFLRGQVHLLKNIERRRHSNCRGNLVHLRAEDDEDDDITTAMSTEIAKLKQEQKALEAEMLCMNKRLAATERRPKQIMALLSLVAEDPQILPRMMLETEQKRQRMLQRSSASSSRAARSAKSEENEELGMAEPLPEGVIVWRPATLADTPSMMWPSGNVDFDLVGWPEESDVRAPPPYPFSLLGGGF